MKTTENSDKKIQSLFAQLRYEDLFNISNHGLIITDSKGYILKTNGVLYRIFGYAEEELCGKHMAMFGVDSDTACTFRSRRERLVKKQSWKIVRPLTRGKTGVLCRWR
jgi:PAS domain S-box-containing protein